MDPSEVITRVKLVRPFRATLVLAAILAAALIFGWKLLFGGCLYSYDAYVHGLWAQQFLKGFDAGNLYPRWLADANAGYGSPTFVFYPPFIFYTYVAIGIFAKDVFYIMQVSAFLALVASGLSMYLYGRLFFGIGVSLIAAVAYMGLPYHLFVIYSSSAVAAFWAFAWMPLILYFAQRLRAGGAGAFYGLCICFSGLVLTHLPTALLFIPFSLAYMVFLYFSGKDKRLLLKGVLALAAGTSLSAVFLLPAVFEQGYVNIASMTGNAQYDFRKNFIFSAGAVPAQLNADVSLMAVAALPLFIIACIIGVAHKGRGAALFFSLSGAASVFLMTGLSRPLWEIFPILQKLQFPWRISAVTDVFAALCIGASLDYFAKAGKRMLFVLVLGTIAVTGLLSASVINNAVMLDRNKFSLTRGMSSEELSRNFKEYFNLMPPDRTSSALAVSSLLVDVAEYRPIQSRPESEAVTALYEENIHAVMIPEGELEIRLFEPEKRLIHVDSTDGGKLLVRTFYYPGWKAYLDGNPIPLEYEPSSGLIYITVPKGSHDLRLVFEGSVWQKAGKYISLLTVALIGLIGVVKTAKKA